jgi:hypothetical protein
MPFFDEGEEVWLIDDDGGAHPGTVQSIVGTRVLVDFDDWKEEFAVDDFTFHHDFLECREVLKPIRRGVIVKKYHS